MASTFRTIAAITRAWGAAHAWCEDEYFVAVQHDDTAWRTWLQAFGDGNDCFPRMIRGNDTTPSVNPGDLTSATTLDGSLRKLAVLVSDETAECAAALKALRRIAGVSRE